MLAAFFSMILINHEGQSKSKGISFNWYYISLPILFLVTSNEGNSINCLHHTLDFVTVLGEFPS